jgi:hypothetical protein
VNLSASPFSVGKPHLRDQMLGSMAASTTGPVFYVNQSGGNDDLVFDGRSSAFNADGPLIARGRAFATDVVIVDLDAGTPLAPATDTTVEADIWDGARARHPRLRPQVRLLRAVPRLSGGVGLGAHRRDRREASGPATCSACSMPSPYSSAGSVDDSARPGAGAWASPR